MAKKVKAFFRKFGSSFVETFREWNERQPFASSAVIAYYTIFSLPGLMVIIINVAGYFFGKEAVTDQVISQVQGLAGGNTGELIKQVVAETSETKGSVISSILGIATLIFGATGVFYMVQQILNKIWEVKPKPKQKFLKLARDRLFSFGLILVIGFLLLVSLVISAALTAVSDWLRGRLPDALLVLFNVLDLLISMAIITVLFAAMFKFLPDVHVAWKQVWVGAILTTVLFVIAKYALGLYFGQSDPGSAYGAAASVVLLMLWVSYSSLLLLFGAEFTRVWAKKSGSAVRPVSYAVSEPDPGGVGSKEKK